MAKHTSVNNTPATGPAAIVVLTTTMIAAGWTVSAWSDGTTMHTASGVPTATDLAHTDAWVRMQDPAGKREWTFQRGTTNVLWRIKRSETGKFVTGSPSATVTPTGATEQIVVGGGTDASPTFATVFDTDGTYRCSAVAFDGVLTSGVYHWAFTCATSFTKQSRLFWFEDGLREVHSLDQSPCVAYLRHQVNLSTADIGWNGIGSINTGPFVGWGKFGLAGQQSVLYRALIFYTGGSQAIPPVATFNLISPSALSPSTEDLMFFVPIVGTSIDSGFSGSSQGFKGVLEHVAYILDYARAYPDTFDLTTDAKIAIGWTGSSQGGLFAMYWEDGTAPLV